MNRNADTLNELKALKSSLALEPGRTPYTAPEGYFNMLAETLVAGVQASEADDPSLVGFSKELPYSVGASYFSGLAEELTKISAKSLPDGLEVPFAKPALYFERLPQRLLSIAKKEARPTKSKVIAWLPQLGRVARMAAAAVLVLGVGMGSYRYLHPVTPEKAVAKQLSKLDGATINTYVELHVDDFDAETLEAAVASAHTDLPASVSSLDAAEIQEYLQESGEVAPAVPNQTL